LPPPIPRGIPGAAAFLRPWCPPALVLGRRTLQPDSFLPVGSLPSFRRSRCRFAPPALSAPAPEPPHGGNSPPQNPPHPPLRRHPPQPPPSADRPPLRPSSVEWPQSYADSLPPRRR